MNNKIVIVFSGFNQRAVIAFLRTMEMNEVPYAIIAKSENDTIFDTIYKSRVFAVRSKLLLDIDDLIEAIEEVKIKTGKNNCLIAPSSEALNRFLLTNRNVFEKKGVVIPLVDRLLYERISDKYSFCRLCENYNILIPKEYKNINTINLPFVAKPISYFSKGQKTYSPQLIYTEQEKENFKREFDENDFYYQQYINGRSFYLLYYFDKKGNVQKYSQENIAQQPDGKSIVAAISSNIHKEKISRLFESMLKKEGFRGLIMIEIKKNKDEYYLIEANPRFWGPSQLFVDAGINFFKFFLYDYGFTDNLTPKSNPTYTKYFWYGGFVEAEKSNKSIVYHIGDNENIIKNSLSDWICNDVYKRTDTINLFNKEIDYER